MGGSPCVPEPKDDENMVGVTSCIATHSMCGKTRHHIHVQDQPG